MPDTSIGNSHINAALHLLILQSLGFERGTDYVMLVQGDDNYMLCTQEVAEKLKEIVALMKEYGFTAVSQVRTASDPSNFLLGEFCSSRFLPTNGKTMLVPKIGRLLAKGVEIPAGADTHKYVTPMMEQYYNCSASTMIKYWAWVWLQFSGKARAGPYPEPEVLHEHTSIYGVTPEEFKTGIGKPSANGTWLIPLNSTISKILELDCPLDEFDIPNSVSAELALHAPVNEKSKLLPPLVLKQRVLVTTPQLEYNPHDLWYDEEKYLCQEACGT